MTVSFRDSQANAFRQLMRAALKRAPLTKSERDVTLALVNLWFHHKAGPEGVIYPGREKLAKKADVSVRTVASVLAMLRENGVIIAVSHARGGRRATRYKLRCAPLLTLCGCDIPDWMDAPLSEVKSVQSCTVSEAKIARLPRAKIAHGKSNTNTLEVSKIDWSNAITHHGEVGNA